MTDNDLHSCLVSSLTARLDRARAATPGPWEHVDFSQPELQPLTTDGRAATFMGCGSVITMGEHVAGGDICAPNGDLYPRSGYSPRNDMAYIAANAPDVEIRRVEAALELCRIYAEAKVYYEANRSAPAGEFHGLLTALKLIAAGEGIEP